MTGILGAPSWQIDTLSILGGDSVDDQGREWVVTDESGWLDAPDVRTNRTDRPQGMGSYRSASFASSRTLTLAGSVWCPDVTTREQTEVELAGVCRDGGRLYDIRRFTDAFDMTAAVERSASTMIKAVTVERVDWSFQFVAPDPRKHDTGWQSTISTLPLGGGGGIDPDNGVLNASGYVDEGVLAVPAIAQVANYGTAPAYPVFTLTGAITQPTIINLETGNLVTYAGSLLAGDVLQINCDEFPAMGLYSHACVLNGTQNVRPLLAHPVEWPAVDPQAAARFQLLSTGSTTAQLMVNLRSAYY